MRLAKLAADKINGLTFNMNRASGNRCFILLMSASAELSSTTIIYATFDSSKQTNK